jgi:DNA-binding SARP family transcriptional activator
MDVTMRRAAVERLSRRCHALLLTICGFVSSQFGGTFAAGGAMDFRILGPVEVATGGQLLRLGGPRQRALLAYLLLHANEAVAADRLLDELWFEPPRGGLAALQTQISRLRRILVDRISTAGSTYSIRVEPGELDLERFRSLLADAGATEDSGTRARLLREADTLWHGAPLAGLDVPFVAGEAAALGELRLAAIEDRIEADLDAGLDGELVSELAVLVRRHPFRERLRGELILALYRSGRQADALSEYRETRRVLDEDLGLEPGPALRELEQAILRHDPLLTPSPAAVSRPQGVDASKPLSPSRRGRVVAALTVLVLGSAAGAFAVLKDLDVGSSMPAQSDAKLPATVTVPTGQTHVRARPKARARRVAHRKTRPRRQSTNPGIDATPAAVRKRDPVVANPSSPTTTGSKEPVARRQQQPATTTTTLPKRSTWRTHSDDFSESVPSPTMWNVDTEGAGATWTLESGRLVVTLLASGVPGGRYNQLSQAFGSQCQFDGDFDARVSYQLLDWAPPTGARVQLSAWIFPDLNSDAARTSTQMGESYWGDIVSTHNSSATNDTQGRLRVTRTNGLVRSYFLENGSWVELNAARAVGRVMIGLQLFAPAEEWQQKETRVAFDDFSVAAPTDLCP